MSEQTPIQKAIIFYQAKRDEMISSCTFTKEEIEIVEDFILYLQSLLKEEEQFAEEAFKAGRKPEMDTLPYFEEYYNKYKQS